MSQILATIDYLEGFANIPILSTEVKADFGGCLWQEHVLSKDVSIWWRECKNKLFYEMLVEVKHNQRGFGGHVFDLWTNKGLKKLKGPWSGNSSSLNAIPIAGAPVVEIRTPKAYCYISAFNLDLAGKGYMGISWGFPKPGDRLFALDAFEPGPGVWVIVSKHPDRYEK